MHVPFQSGALPVIAILCSTLVSPVFGTDISIEAKSIGHCSWNGINDVSPCIQQAIDVASGSGGIVLIPAGTWSVSKVIVVLDNITLKGDKGRTVLRPTVGNVSNPVLLSVNTGAHNVAVKGITFDGGGIDFPNDKPVISGTTVANVLFDHVVVRNTRGIGLLLQGGTTGSGVRHSRFVNIGNHWRMTAGPWDRIQGLVFCCSSGNANNYAIGNYFRNIGLDALEIGDQDGFVAQRNLFELSNEQLHLVKADDYPAGIFILHSRHVYVDGNSIRNAPGSGIDAPGLQESHISNNEITGSGHAGVGIFFGYDHETQAKNILIARNTVSNNVRWSHATFLGGITISGGMPSDVTLSGNTVTDTQSVKTQRYGLYVARGTRVLNLRIDPDNRLSGNSQAATAVE